jgi:predicted exporter
LEHLGWLERLLGDWGASVPRRRGVILWITLAVTLISIPLAVRALTHLDVNLFNQASDKLQRFRLARELSEDFGGDTLAAVLSIPDQPSAQQVQELKAFADLLAAELSAVGTHPDDHAALPEALQPDLPAGTPWLKQVECRTGQGIEQALRKMVRDRPYVVLRPEDAAALKKLFEPDALAAAMERIEKTVADLPPNSLEKLRLQEDPLGLAAMANDALRQRMAERGRALGGSDSDGFFLSPDHTTLVVLARAALPATKLDFCRALMDAVQRAENRAVNAFRATKPALTTALKGGTYSDLAAGETPGTLSVGFTGMPAVSVENEMSLRYDLIGNTATSFVGVLLLFLIVFRQVILAWDVTWTTAAVIVWTLAVAGATRGSVSILGGAFTCILLGTGTDYAIHLHSAYHTYHYVQGMSPEESLRLTLSRCGPGILMAALTTALAFFGIAFTSFVGLAEFGLLAGTAVVFGCAAMLLVFPALLCRPPTIFARLGRWGREEDAPEPLGLGLPQFGRVLESRAAKVACVMVGVAALAAGLLFIKFGPDPGPDTVAGVRFDADLGNLRSLRIKAIPLRNRLAERFGLGLADVRVVVAAADEDRAYAGQEAVAQRLRPFSQRGELSPGGSILDFVPSPEQQQATIAALKSFDFEAATDAFKSAAKARFGDRGLVFFKPFLKQLHDYGLLTREPTPLRLATVVTSPLGSLLAPFVKLEPGAADPAGRVRLASSWFPTRLDMPPGWYWVLARSLEAEPPPGVTIKATAARMVGFEMKRSLLRDCGVISLIVGLCVALSLATAFRCLSTSLVSIIPLLFAFVSLLAGVALAQWLHLDFSLNFVNLIMFPLLLGSSIDVGIYMVYEARSTRRPRISELMGDTGRSVLCCALTTLVGFGAFFWSSYTGLISLGIAAFFGYTGALFGALVVLPGILGLWYEREAAQGKLPAAARADVANGGEKECVEA